MVVVSAGEGSWVLPTGMADEILTIGCRPSSETSEYDLYIRDDEDGWEIFRRDNNIGIYSEVVTSPVPLWGDNTVHISGATVDGNYVIRMIYK